MADLFSPTGSTSKYSPHKILYIREIKSTNYLRLHGDACCRWKYKFPSTQTSVQFYVHCYRGLRLRLLMKYVYYVPWDGVSVYKRLFCWHFTNWTTFSASEKAENPDSVQLSNIWCDRSPRYLKNSSRRAPLVIRGLIPSHRGTSEENREFLQKSWKVVKDFYTTSSTESKLSNPV
jgi:hypothetical protein